MQKAYSKEMLPPMEGLGPSVAAAALTSGTGGGIGYGEREGDREGSSGGVSFPPIAANRG